MKKFGSHIKIGKHNRDYTKFCFEGKPPTQYEGSNLYGLEGSTMHRFSLSNPWSVSTISHVESAQVPNLSNITGFTFDPSGQRAYFETNESTVVHQYRLNTAFDINTLQFVKSFDFSIGGSSIEDITAIEIKRDGSKIIFTDDNVDSMYSYTLSTPWQIDSASFDTEYSITIRNRSSATALFIDKEGNRVYHSGDFENRFWVYDMSTGWDLSTISLSYKEAYKAGIDGVNSIDFKPDGLKFYFYNGNTRDFVQYDLSTAWDLRTATEVARYDLQQVKDVSWSGFSF